MATPESQLIAVENTRKYCDVEIILLDNENKSQLRAQNSQPPLGGGVPHQGPQLGYSPQGPYGCPPQGGRGSLHR